MQKGKFTIESFNPKILYLYKRKFSVSDVATNHNHDFASMVFILSGHCTYEVNGTSHTVKKGDLLVLNPGVNHMRVLIGEREVLELHIGIDNLARGILPDTASTPIIKFVRYENEFLACINEIIFEQERDGLYGDMFLKALIMKLILLIQREIAAETERETGGMPYFSFESYDRISIVKAIMSYMSENYMDDISLGKISKNMYLSPVYISRIFREETGDSPINYLIKIRLAKAAELLTQGNITVKAAAKSVGYDDAYHFSKIFKKYYNISPSAMKAKRRTNT